LELQRETVGEHDGAERTVFSLGESGRFAVYDKLRKDLGKLIELPPLVHAAGLRDQGKAGP
jgi:hypothetical protein